MIDLKKIKQVSKDFLSRVNIISFFLVLLFINKPDNALSQVRMYNSGNYTQNFDSLGSVSGNTYTWTDNTTIPNWFAQRTSAVTSYLADDGSLNTGFASKLYSFGTNGSTDRALGCIGSSTTTASFAYGLLLQNISGYPITDIKVSYTLEQWKKVNVNNRLDTITFWYKIGNSPVTTLNPNASNSNSWIQVTALALISPILGVSTTSSSLDGNASANRRSVANISIPGLSLDNNQYITIKWDDPDITGSDHGLAIDDVTVAWTANSTPLLAATPVTPLPLTTTQPNASTNASFTLTGYHLSNNNITITPPNGFEIDAGSGFSSGTITVPYTDPSSLNFSIRLMANIAPGPYGGNITISFPGLSTIYLYISPCTVYPSGTSAAIYINNDNLTGLSTTYGTASAPSSFLISAANLTVTTVGIRAPVSATSNFKISLTPTPESSFVDSLTLNVTSGKIAATIIYVILSSTAPAGIYSPTSPSTTNTIKATASSFTTTKIPQSIVYKCPQSIPYFLQSTKKTNTDIIKLSGKTNVGFPITYTSSNTNIATITDSVLTFVGVGSVTINARQSSGNSNYDTINLSKSVEVLNTIAKWTFDGISLNTGTSSTPIVLSGSSTADLGIEAPATSSDFASNTSVSSNSLWSTPSGNGSTKCINASNWIKNSFYQFDVQPSLSTYHNLSVIFDQYSASNGPNKFKLQYSTDPTGPWTDYYYYTTPSVNSWNGTYYNDSSQIVIDLTALSSLNNINTAYLSFRLVDTSSLAVSGGSSIDNFRLAGMPSNYQSRQTGNLENNTSWFIGTNLIPTYGVYPRDTLCDVTVNPSHTITTTANATVGNLQINAGTLTLSADTFNIAGNFTRAGTLNNNNKIVKFVGASNSTISKGSTIPSGQFFSNLFLNKTASKSLTLNDSIIIGKEIRISSGTLNLSNKDVILSSNATNGTATYGVMGANGALNYGGTGRFIVERYIPTGTSNGNHKKSWQLLSIPTNGDGQTIRSSWQEGATSASSNPNQGYGIQISGPAGTPVGFDTATIAPSVKTYDAATNSWVGIANTTSTSIYNKKGYMVFVRGSRKVRALSTPADSTILRTKGKIFEPSNNPPPIDTVLSGKYESIGNPYASPLDFTLLSKSAVDDKFYVWDPTLAGNNGFGGYQTFNSINGYVPTPGGTTNYPSGKACKIVQSGQAFFVYNSSGSIGTISFTEASKVSSDSSRATYRINNATDSIERLTTYLLVKDTTFDGLLDGNTVVFGNNYSNEVDAYDAIKILNPSANIGIKRNDKILAVEARPEIVSSDTIFYSLSGLNPNNYQLKVVPQLSSLPFLSAILIDNYLHTRINVSYTDTTTIDFVVNSDLMSGDANRFMLVFQRPSIALPVTFVSIDANQNTASDINVNWTVTNEININHYELERSNNGVDFEKIATQLVLNNSGAYSNYSYLDNNFNVSDLYYRVKAVESVGQIIYSKVVKVQFDKKSSSISIQPNPIKNGQIRVLFGKEYVGVCNVELINLQGQVLFRDKRIIKPSNGGIIIKLNSNPSPGIYQLKLGFENGKTQVVSVSIN